MAEESAVIGKDITRVDGYLKVTGGARYGVEYALEKMTWGVGVGSTVGVGKIISIDTSEAEKMPGVIGVMTSENCMQLHFPAGSDPGAGKYAEKDLLPLQNLREI